MSTTQEKEIIAASTADEKLTKAEEQEIHAELRRAFDRWPEERRPGFPEFDPAISDGCTGVRQIARWCCVAHDVDYFYGRHIGHKIMADVRLCTCIWRDGWRRVRNEDDPGPYLSLLAWGVLGVTRMLGVLFLGWKPFYAKPHKRMK